jgi:preprotein translocase subunit SecE
MRPHPGFASESNVHHSPSRNGLHRRRKAKLAAVAVLVIGSIAAFYLLGQQDMWLRAGAAGRSGCAVGVFFVSDAGKQIIAYGRDSVREVKKVVWPTRKEATQMTAMCSPSSC